MSDLYATAKPERELDPLLLSFLLGRALELALKAILRNNGTSSTALKAIGHDLQVAHQEVCKAPQAPKGLRLTSTRKAHLAILSDVYKSKALEYLSVRAYRVPPLYLTRGLVHDAIAHALDQTRGPGTARRLAAEAVPGAFIPPEANYGNQSRRRVRRALARDFEKALSSECVKEEAPQCT